MSQQQHKSLDERIEEVWPAPGYRTNQKEAVKHIVKQVEENDTEVILLDAPPGFGKSLTLWTAGRLLGDTFYTTPLNTLVDQLERDEFIGDKLMTMKGRRHYKCIHPEDDGNTVDKAICQKNSEFECEIKGECHYYGRKMNAKKHPILVTNLSFLMAESMIPDMVEHKLGERDVMIADECQNIEDFAMGNISITLSRNTVPEDVWRNLSVPSKKYENNMEHLTGWMRDDVLETVQRAKEHIRNSTFKSDEELGNLETLQQFENKISNFLNDVKQNHWVCKIETKTYKNRKPLKRVVFEPINIGGHMDSYLWSRGDTIILSSATVPGGSWLDDIGLGDRKTSRIKIPSPFPVENRPIITNQMVGKMTKSEREGNAWPMAQKIRQLANHHEGERGFVHCRSYGIAEMLKRSYVNHQEGQWFRDNVYMQDRDDREGSLEDWLESDKQVFFSVNMAEGIDLEGSKCRWQVLAKVLYPHLGNKRWKYILNEMNDWDRYNRNAVTQIEQAYGRGVRSEEDECVFYLLDKSVANLLQMNSGLFHKWFLQGVNFGAEATGGGIKVDENRGI